MDLLKKNREPWFLFYHMLLGTVHLLHYYTILFCKAHEDMQFCQCVIRYTKTFNYHYYYYKQ